MGGHNAFVIAAMIRLDRDLARACAREGACARADEPRAGGPGRDRAAHSDGERPKVKKILPPCGRAAFARAGAAYRAGVYAVDKQ